MRQPLTPSEKEIIGNALTAPQTGRITLDPGGAQGETAREMNRFCDEIRSIAPRIKVKKDDDTGFPPPAMIVGRHANIAYHTVPRGKLIQRFAAALAQDSVSPGAMDEPSAALLAGIKLPVALRLYVAEQCPHCPLTLDKLQTLAGASSKIRLGIIDAAKAPQARIDEVRAVPTLILDDQFRWSGQFDLQEVLTMAIERDPTKLSPASLRQLIEEGAAESVADMMIARNACFPALIELLAHERWSVRLGAMVTVEYLVDAAPELAAGLAAPLRRRMDGASQQAQGDMVHILGQVGTPECRRYLRHIVDADFAQPVRAAAREALEDLHTP